jgi:hypothetical protein
MAKPTERFKVMKSGVTLGRVYREGETFGYTDLPMRNREKLWETVTANEKGLFEAVTDEADDMPVVMNLTNNSPSQPQGSPDAPLAGDSPEAKAAKQFKNMETAGVVSQAAGLQGGTGADVEAMAERADAELEFRGEANPNAAVGDFVPEPVDGTEPTPSAEEQAKAAESKETPKETATPKAEDAETEDKPKGTRKSS